MINPTYSAQELIDWLRGKEGVKLDSISAMEEAASMLESFLNADKSTCDVGLAWENSLLSRRANRAEYAFGALAYNVERCNQLSMADLIKIAAQWKAWLLDVSKETP